MSKQAKRFYEFGPFRIDPMERILLRGDRPVPLTPKAFDMLLVLVQNSGHIVEKDALMEKVWPGSFVEEGNLKTTIFMLRKTLGEVTGQNKYIETVPRRGYRFVALVSELWDENEKGLGLNTSTKEKVIRSIAVLPFKPLSADAGDQYLGLGMADALITRISNIRQFIVRPTSAVCKYTGLEQDPVAVGRELRVESVLEGSIRRLGDRIRVTVQLVSVSHEAPLWADKFDERFTDIFTVEDSISKEVADRLALKLTSEDKQRLAKHHTENVEAYHLYLKGRYHWHKWTLEGFKKSIDYYQQAIERDPAYGLAYSGLADSYSLLSIYGFMSPEDAMPKAEAAAMRALEIDEQLAEAHTSLAIVRGWYDWNWSAAERGFKRSIMINPNSSASRYPYAIYLAVMGRFDDAIAEMKQAQDLDPLSLVINTDVGWMYIFARQYDQAIEQCQKTLDLDPDHYQAYERLGHAYMLKGMYDQAIPSFQKAIALTGGQTFSVSLLGHTYAKAGARDEAQRIIEQLKRSANREFDVAAVYAGFGENDQVFRWLKKACEKRSGALVYIKVEPAFDSLRSDPRYSDLLRLMRLRP